MPAKTLTYSFLDVQASIVGPGGAFNLGNGAGADDEGISIEPLADVDNMVVGADGTGMHSLSADRSARVTVRLLKTSPVNAQLSAMMALQRSSGALHGQNTIALVDSARGDVITLRQVAFARQPALQYGKVAGVIEWQFNAAAMDPTLGAIGG